MPSAPDVTQLLAAWSRGDEVLAKGVEFTQEPVEHPYCTDVGLRDPFGNHIRIVQLRA